MSFRQRGADGPSTGSGHQFASANSPFGPVVRSARAINAENRQKALDCVAAQRNAEIYARQVAAQSAEATRRAEARARAYQDYLEDNAYTDAPD